MNYVVLIGKLESRPEPLSNNTSSKYSLFNLAITNNFRNSHGKYEVHSYPICINRGYHDQTLDIVALNSNLSVKGRLEYLDGKIVIIAENIEIIYA